MDRSSNIVSFDDARAVVRVRSKIPAHSVEFAGTGVRAGSGARGRAGAGAGGAGGSRVLAAGDAGAVRGRAGVREGRASGRGGAHAAGHSPNSRRATSDSAQDNSIFAAAKNAKRALTKKRADKAFDKAYGAADAGAKGAAGAGASAQAAGPRAAVYKTQMGAAHKRAAKIQQKSSGAGVGAGASGAGVFSKAAGAVGGFFSALVHGRASGRALHILVACACCVVMCVSLYSPMQTYYQQIREKDRLTAEYAAIAERNDYLQGVVDYLQTDEGIEDKARSDFGLVQEGENSATVVGVDAQDSSIYVANIAVDSVPAPDTWYSGVLDVFFNYQPQHH